MKTLIEWGRGRSRITNMSKIGLVFFAATVALAQPLTLSVSPQVAFPGQSVTLTVGFTDASPSLNMSGVQWTLTFPPSLSPGAPSLGASALSASKVLTCNGQTCVLVG